MPKQRFFLPREYAALISERAAAAGVPTEVYLQNLIASDYMGGASSAPAAAQPAAIAPPAASDDGLTLSGDWDIKL